MEQVCNSKDGGDTMILCDFCQGGIHMECHDPPLEEIPEDDEWYCPNCRDSVPKLEVAKRLHADYMEARAEAGVTDSIMIDMLALMLEGKSLSDSENVEAAPGDGPSEPSGTAVGDHVDVAKDLTVCCVCTQGTLKELPPKPEGWHLIIVSLLPSNK
jgi:hypothetical protein